MQLDGYLGQVHDQLTAAAALGDDRTQAVATALSGALDSSIRLAIVTAVSDAAAEITTALLDAPGTPSVRAHLDGEDVVFEMHSGEPASPPSDDGEASARISLRLSDSLKSSIDAAAGREGVSVNTWLVRVASTASRTPDGSAGFRNPATHRGRSDQHLTGWVTG